MSVWMFDPAGKLVHCVAGNRSLCGRARRRRMLALEAGGSKAPECQDCKTLEVRHRKARPEEDTHEDPGATGELAREDSQAGAEATPGDA